MAKFQIYEWKRVTGSDVFTKHATASGAFGYYKYHTPLTQFSQTQIHTQFSQTQIQQTSNFFKMLPDLNYYPDEENYTAEQPSGSNFLTGIFLNHNQTNSYQTYDQTNSYQTYDQTNSYQTYDQTNSYSIYDRTNSYQTYDQTNSYQTYDQTNSYQTYDQTNSYSIYDRTNSYQTYDQTNSYPTYDQTNLYPYPAIYSNNIIYQQPNSAVPLYNFFGGSSSTTSGSNLAHNIGRTEKQNNIDGRSSVDPAIMKLSDDHDDQDEQDDGGLYYSNEEET
jgi:hypothetical protein